MCFLFNGPKSVLGPSRVRNLCDLINRPQSAESQALIQPLGILVLGRDFQRHSKDARRLEAFQARLQQHGAQTAPAALGLALLFSLNSSDRSNAVP